MRKLFYGALCLLLGSCTTEKTGLVLEGNMTGIGNDHLVISKQTGRFESVPVDTVEVVNGKFRYENPEIQTDNYSFRFLDAQCNFSAILEPVKLKITGNAAAAERGWLPVKIEGGRNNSFREEFQALRENLLKEQRFAAYAECLNRLRKSQSKEEADQIREEMEPLEKAFHTELFPKEQELLRKNTDLFAIQTVMPFCFSSYQAQAVEICKQIPDELRNTASWQEIEKEITSYEATRPGKIAPDFTLYTPDSTALTLSDLRGKYVLLDFWASWCAPCRAAFPKLKELYKKYKSQGFEILGVTNDTNHEQWKKAIQQDGTSWLHVADEFPAPPAFGTAKVISMYGFHYLPSTMLIDPQGKIVGKLEGEKEIETKLQEIFGE